MPPKLPIPKNITFGPHPVGPQVFHTTPHSFALVNLKPLLPGHVLVCPLRPVSRLSQLSGPEISDLFLTVQRVSAMLERVFKAHAFNVAVQDGAAAGQSVPHVHAHIIPRHRADFGGEGDRVYDLLEGEEGDVGAHQREAERMSKEDQKAFKKSDEERKPREMDEMRKEAEWLRGEMKKDDE